MQLIKSLLMIVGNLWSSTDVGIEWYVSIILFMIVSYRDELRIHNDI